MSRPDRSVPADDLLVRDAVVDDAEEISAVHVRSWQVAYRGIIPDDHLDGMREGDRAARWRTILPTSAATTHVAVRDGRVVAFASCGPDRDDPRRGEVWAIYADPDAWGSGAGHAVMQRACDLLRSAGFRDAVLWVLEDNARARAFYTREGWVPDGGRKTEVIGGAEVVEVRLRRQF